MEKKIKFSENPNLAKTIYGIVIVVLCITAIVIGIVAANNGSNNTLQNDPPASDTQPPENEKPDNTPPAEDPPSDENPDENPPSKKPEKKSFLAPVAGNITKGHSLTVPVFSTTLEEWRVHSGIDIGCDDGAEVFAAFDGTVSEIYTDPLLGCTVVIDHGSDVKTMYSNLVNDDTLAEVGAEIKAGDMIGTVGDTSLSELAEEPHLHFEVSVNGVKADPLEYISDDSKSAFLGITV